MEKKPVFANRNVEIDDLLRNLPDTQEDIIVELRSDILNSTYKMNPEKIVERILWHGVHVLRMSERIS